MARKKKSENKYFALLPADEIGKQINRIDDDYKEECRRYGLLNLWQDSYYQYFRGLYTRGQVEYQGRAGEFRGVSYNHYRNLLKHILTITTAQAPAWEPMAVNADFESTSQIQIAKNLLDYYTDTKGLEEYMLRAAEYAIFLGEGYLIDEWDPNLGEVVLDDSGGEITEKGRVIREGDIVYENAAPIDVARDMGVKAYKDLEWHIVTTYRSKHSLAAEFPEVSEEIIASDWEPNENELFFHRKLTSETDSVPVKTLYHKKTPALPDGRIVRIVDDVVLFDTKIPYDSYPVKRIAPDEIHYIPFGYSIGFDLLQLQKVKDMLESTIATNQDLFGVQNIMYPVGSNMTPENFHDGLNFIPFDPDKGTPQPLNLVSTPQEIFANKDSVVNEMQVLSAVNSVMRGNPDSNIRSGSQSALMQSIGAQFNSKYEQSYTRFREAIGNSLIQMFKSFADTKRIVQVAGESERFYLKEFKGDDLSAIQRIVVKAGNPMTKTTSGRMAVADALLERGMMKAPSQYFQVMETGRLEPIVKRERAEMDLIQKENEMIQEGEVPPVIDTDNHLLHINEHTVNTSSPEARMNQKITAANLEHIMEHFNALGSLPPELLMLLGQRPVGMQQGPPEGPPPAEGVNNQQVAPQPVEQPPMADVPTAG